MADNKPNPMLFGQILVNIGAATQEQVAKAEELNQIAKGLGLKTRIGDILTGKVDEVIKKYAESNHLTEDQAREKLKLGPNDKPKLDVKTEDTERAEKVQKELKAEGLDKDLSEEGQKRIIERTKQLGEQFKKTDSEANPGERQPESKTQSDSPDKKSTERPLKDGRSGGGVLDLSAPIETGSANRGGGLGFKDFDPNALMAGDRAEPRHPIEKPVERPSASVR